MVPAVSSSTHGVAVGAEVHRGGGIVPVVGSFSNGVAAQSETGQLGAEVEKAHGVEA